MSPYKLQSLWRYPVKSMAGEELTAVDVTADGLTGDRAYALVDTASGKVGSAKSVKRFGELLKYQARFVKPPQATGRVLPVRITTPDGTIVHSDQPETAAAFEAAFGPDVALLPSAPPGLMLEFPAGTLGGK